MRKQCIGGYRFGFNGQEKDDEVYGEGNSYTAEYWQYDPRLGRRWNVDPQPRTWESAYSCLGNNPIKNIDVKGNKWDPNDNDSQGYADGFIKQTDNKISKVNDEISYIDNLMKGMDPKSKKYNDLAEKTNNLNNQLQELTDAKFEMNAIIESDQTYRLSPFLEDPSIKTYTNINGNLTNTGGDGGETYYEKGVVVIKYGHGRFNTMAHELKHAYQFEIGQLSFNKVSGKGGSLYDITDEQAAYKRGSAFSIGLGKPLINLSTSDLTSRYAIPKIPLDKTSTVQKVMSARYETYMLNTGEAEMRWSDYKGEYKDITK